MDYLEIIGGSELKGEVAISGAKNAALPLLSAALLAKNKVHIQNLPNVADVKTLAKLLEHLGCNIEWENPHSLSIDASQIIHTKAIYDIVRKMRASILVLGPLLARCGHCEVSLPGGCAIGARPVDLHIAAMEKMGAEINIHSGYIIASAPKGLKGAQIVFDKITVTGCENVIMAAALAKGRTQIINAAREPEVVQLCEVLMSAGVKIEGIGTSTLEIEGSDREALDFAPIEVIPDRIEAGTYLCAGAMTNSQIRLTNANPTHMQAMLEKLKQIGFGINASKNSIEITPAKKRVGFEIVTTEHPGFPTDMQAQFMALATQCEGTSFIQERLFENRFMHVSELQRLGANITLKGNSATIVGNGGINDSKNGLVGADVMATDLRASSALVLAGLVAQGSTRVHRIYHLDRGYEKLEDKLTMLGAKIERKKEEAV
ncbi:UDP-N-acetylglucosamine 1-carboxyvinyltransferase [Helicobacter sp. CLO-3]|uniref:UDP-N-acetylglucosamine 1-carboxyvinyltransferase n=1 Tax=unclassified Helicobacter TaxID=2593540 RepID=UPI0008059956|nr:MULTISPECIES: UDP-N-acetylglucosamine 1-carboxyvinyltransferase [unclassified Helicobacter]OBV28920.1 UDP-N-acetylglucosamine 1-carboxyvinyltransferase [Helicobacter sp. CLO-3]OHU83921.1 UDP-N-acetylglucosamine 1-carboxyvinyltransferase [Helicobacter sp. CLO-3]